MAVNKQKLPKFTGQAKEDPVRHCRTCETIWAANGVTDQDEWIRQFPATLREGAIDWYSDVDKTGLTTWNDVKKAFQTEFQLLRDDNEILAEIYNTKQTKSESVRAYGRRLKELIGKMESAPADELKKRWFVEGLKASLRKKMKIVPPTSYSNAYNRAMDLESEYKTSRKIKSSDDESEAESSEGESSKKVLALQKDLVRMMTELKATKGGSRKAEEDTVWCTDCKEAGHTKGSCPKKAFCDICQIAGHSTKECPYNLRARNQQVLFTQEQPSTSGTGGQQNAASSGGYRNNRRGGRGNDENKPRVQYDAKGRPMIQCRSCNQWGHYARDCHNEGTAPLRLCRWCGPGDHEDANCSKPGCNILDMERGGTERILTITRGQAKKATYPHPPTEKQRMLEAKAEIAKGMEDRRDSTDADTSTRAMAEQNILRQMMQMEVPVKVKDLLETMPHLKTALFLGQNIRASTVERTEVPDGSAANPMMLSINNGQNPAVVEMGILGTILTNTIVDGGSGVNVLPEETWKSLGKPTLWPPTFNLLGADQHGIKPLGTLMAQQVTIGTQPFILDFVVIPLKQKGYDAILGRGWLVTARANHNWQKNILSIEKGGRKFVIDLATQMVGEEMASSSDSESDDGIDGGEETMEPNAEGILKVEDDTDSMDGLFHWQMGDYELFPPSCNILKIEEAQSEFLPEHTIYREEEVRMKESPAHEFWKEEPIWYKEEKLEKIKINLGDERNPKTIATGDNWNPVWKTVAFKILILLLLMYGQEAVVPVEFMVPSLWIAIENGLGHKESLREQLHNEIKQGTFREVGHDRAVKLWTLDERIHDAINGSKLKPSLERMDQRGRTKQLRAWKMTGAVMQATREPSVRATREASGQEIEKHPYGYA